METFTFLLQQVSMEKTEWIRGKWTLGPEYVYKVSIINELLEEVMRYGGLKFMETGFTSLLHKLEQEIPNLSVSPFCSINLILMPVLPSSHSACIDTNKN